MKEHPLLTREAIEAFPPHVQKVIAHANRLVAHGCEVHFKFTCVHCGARVFFEDRDSFYIKGSCDICHKDTSTLDERCKLNFAVIASGEAAVYLAADMGLHGGEVEES